MHTGLCTDDDSHEQETDWDADGHLNNVGVNLGNFNLNLSLRVNGRLIIEIRSLCRDILEIAAKPHVSDKILLALPAFVEKRGPEHDEYTVEDHNGRGKQMRWLLLFGKVFNDHVNAEDGANDGSRDQPARVVNEPREVEAELLTIVVLDFVERLHVLQESDTVHHTSGEPKAVLFPRCYDRKTIRHVYREVVEDDTTLHQIFKIHFLLERLHHNGLDLARVKLIEHVASVALEGKHAVVLGQTALDVENLAH